MKLMVQRETPWAGPVLLAAALLQLPIPVLAQIAPAAAPAVIQEVRPTINPTSTILPTDTLPLPAVQNRMTFAENLQLRILQKLPARFYFNTTCETSFRDETNPFQFPRKASLMRQLPRPEVWRELDAFQQAQLYDEVGMVARNDMIFRVLPNVTGGWTFTPRTRLYGNYFMIRDSLMHVVRLNTVIHSVGMGLQQDIPVTSRLNLQGDFQFRELFQLHQRPVFDFLPGLTASYIVTPRLVLFANALFQLRGKHFFQAPTKEMDPFYTWGALYQRNGWTFSASTTFVQNFREPFHSQATIPVNNYSFISDYEIARRVIKQVPGLQAFVRAEPIWNFHGKDKPGLSGIDFRLFFGLRMAMSKPALTSALESLRQQLEEEENEAPPPAEKNKPVEKKPSAYIAPHELVASGLQPIHGFFDQDGKEGRSMTVADFADYQDEAMPVQSAAPAESTTPLQGALPVREATSEIAQSDASSTNLVSVH